MVYKLSVLCVLPDVIPGTLVAMYKYLLSVSPSKVPSPTFAWE